MRTFMVLMRATADGPAWDAMIARLDEISTACAEAISEGEMRGLLVTTEQEAEDVMRAARAVADPRKGGWVWVMEMGREGSASGNPRGWNRWKRLVLRE